MIDLNNVLIRYEFIKYIGNEYDSVVCVDILNKVIIIDFEMGSEYEKYLIVWGLVIVIFLYLFSGGECWGIIRLWLRIIFLREGIFFIIVGDVFSKFEDFFYYFYVD